MDVRSADLWRLRPTGQWHRHARSIDGPRRSLPERVAPGHSFQVTAVVPNGHVEPLLWLHGYDAHYAHPFLLRTPPRLPAGTVIRGVPPNAILVLLS